MDLEKKVALVTGASGGLGSAIALDLAKEGCKLILHYHENREKIENLEKEIQEKYGVETMVLNANLMNENAIEKMVEEGINTFGKIDILVNNAGICIDSFVEDKKVEDFRKTLDINLIGPFLVSKYVSKSMLKQGEGTIIHIGSTNGLDAYCPMSLEYDASKAALHNLTHNLALQYAPYIRVNAVAPGWIETEMSKCEDKELEEEFVREESKKIYLGRFARPEEIAHVVTFLASPKASYINSTIIRVDGGF